MLTETILGVNFFNGTVDEAVDAMCANGGLLVVPAAPALVKLGEDEGYRRALRSADMVIADSGAMVLLWRIVTGRRVERIYAGEGRTQNPAGPLPYPDDGSC